MILPFSLTELNVTQNWLVDGAVRLETYSDFGSVAKEIFNYKAKFVTDLFVSYKFCRNFTLFAGADNVFNIHPNYAAVPNARYEAFDNETGGPWESVQMGVNGRKIFTKLAFNF